MLKDKIDNGAFLLLQCSLVEVFQDNCSFRPDPLTNIAAIGNSSLRLVEF
jgi:hypothetical protein